METNDPWTDASWQDNADGNHSRENPVHVFALFTTGVNKAGSKSNDQVLSEIASRNSSAET